MTRQQASTPVSSLRRSRLDDMAMRGLHEDTQRNTIMSVRNFAAFLGRSPETATAEDVRRFQIHQADSGVQPPTVNNAVSGLRFSREGNHPRPMRQGRGLRRIESLGRRLSARPSPARSLAVSPSGPIGDRIAAALSTFAVYKTRGGYTLAEPRTGRSIARIKPLPNTDRFELFY